MVGADEAVPIADISRSLLPSAVPSYHLPRASNQPSRLPSVVSTRSSPLPSQASTTSFTSSAIGISPANRASDNFRLPTFFEDGLIALNNSIPTLDRVKDKINAVISSPLKLLRTDVNNTINAFQFDRSVTALQVSNSTTIAAATTPLDELAHAVHELETFLLLALLFAMLLVGLCTVGLEWCAWRSMWRHVRLIRDVCGREKGESIDVPESEKQKAAEAEKMEASDDQVDLDNGHDDTVAHRRALESYRSLTFRISAALDGRRIAACPTDDLKGLMGAAAESPFRKTLLSEAIGASSGRKLVSYQEKTRARLTDSRALYMSA